MEERAGERRLPGVFESFEHIQHGWYEAAPSPL
jgi:hypothetical protein